MFRKITFYVTFHNYTALTKLVYLIYFILVLTVGYAWGSEKYTWTGDAGDGLWKTAGNWEPVGPPPRNSGAVSIIFSNEMQMMPITIPAGYNAECGFGDHFGTIFGPAFGMHLDIYGSLTYKWYLCAGQTNPAGQRSIINMFSGSSIYGAEGLAIGDNWWLPGPYVTMNMYGNSVVDVNWLWVGGHINLYGGTMNIKQGVNMCVRHRINDDPNNIVKIDDSLTKLDIYAGKLILPSIISDADIKEWIAKGILLSYGRKPGIDGCNITIDTKTTPGKIILSATPGSDAMAKVYYNEKTDEAQLWSLMEQAVSSIESNKLADTDAIIDNLLSNFNSNPRSPQVLNYVADMYEFAKKYDKAKAILQQLATKFPQNIQVGNIPFALARIDVLSDIEAEKVEAIAGIDNLIAKFSNRTDLLPTLVGTVAEGLYNKGLRMKMDTKGQRQAYLKKAVDLWEMAAAKSPTLVHTADGYNWAGHCYRNIGQYQKAIDYYNNVVEKFPKFAGAWNAQFLIGQCYEEMKKTKTIDETQANSKTKEAYQKLVDNYPDCKAVVAAKSWLEKN